MIEYSREIGRPHLLRCLIGIFLPVLLFIPAQLVSYFSGISPTDSSARISNSPSLTAKKAMNGTLGVIGLSLWGLLMLPPALIALYQRKTFLIEVNGNFVFLGKIICKLSDINDAFLKESGMKKTLYVVTESQTIEVGNIAMCEDPEGAAAEVKRLGLRSCCAD